MGNKRANGQYFTVGNPFCLKPFRRWADKVDLPNTPILEPFAGSNNMIETLSEMGLCNYYSSFDIEPAAKEVSKRNTIEDFPKSFNVCITNPP